MRSDRTASSPLCAATIWGYDGIVRLLLDATCDPNVRNGDGMRNSLHAAASQEHGKMVHLLLQTGAADAILEDGEGRTACDFASVSDAVWPLFAARGLERTPKSTLVDKRVIHKVFTPTRRVTSRNLSIRSSLAAAPSPTTHGLARRTHDRSARSMAR